MVKKSVPRASVVTASSEWDSAVKEPWHLAFEAEPINDEKWNCVVTAIIPSEAADDECIQNYVQCVNTGIRKFIKIISMSDVVKLLKGSTSTLDTQRGKENRKKPEKPDKKSKTAKPEKTENMVSEGLSLPTPRFSQIVRLAASYAVFTDSECKLPSDLMAAVIKYLILKLKDENCLEIRVEAVKKRKMREKNIKAKFIRSLKPFEVSEEERKSFSKFPPNILGLDKPIDDRPFNGPDLYILLTDFYDLFVFPQLRQIGVPLLALLKVSLPKDRRTGKSSLTFLPSRVDATNKKELIVSEFWIKLSETCITLEETKKFKDIMIMLYEAPFVKAAEAKQDNLRKIFDELSWVQYHMYTISRQHQMYLRELHVQPLVLSLQRLDLASCEVYNKICDVLVSGQPLTPALVLFAIIEQVVVGVPETESVISSYEYNFSSLPTSESQLTTLKNDNFKHAQKKIMQYTTPCDICRSKVRIGDNVHNCGNLQRAYLAGQTISLKEEQEKGSLQGVATPEDDFSRVQYARCKELQIGHDSGLEEVRTQMVEETSANTLEKDESLTETVYEPLISTLPSKEPNVSETLSKIFTEKKSEKSKKWKAPILCFHGDQILPQMYHCDPEILTPETMFKRFFQNSIASQIWKKFPEMESTVRAFFNFQFASLRKISKETEEVLKLKVYFTISMKLIGISKSFMYRGNDENFSDFTGLTEKQSAIKPHEVKFEQNAQELKQNSKNFKKSFFKPFAVNTDFHIKRKYFHKTDTEVLLPYEKLNDHNSLRKAFANFNMTLIMHHRSGASFPLELKQPLTHSSDFLSSIFNSLDHPEISNLLEPHFLNDKNDHLRLIQGFTFYEKLEPNIMIQRLIEAQENYNTIHYSYFKPTNSVVLVMMNDVDHRGIFYTQGTGVLETPVCLRDFYIYIYRYLKKWVIKEDEMYMKFITDLEEQIKNEEDKKDEMYLRELKRNYCEMSPEERQNFLETVVDIYSEPEVREEELEDLPIKPKYCPVQEKTFVTTNLTDLRIQIEKKVNEFHSQDGTELNVIIESWLYDPSSLLCLIIKRPELRLYHYLWLDRQTISTSFTLKTNSDLTFSFYKDGTEEETGFNYKVNISWPTGLLIQPVAFNSGLYIRQSYLKICRSGWDIEEEKSRCFLQNGQVIIYKENGDFSIFCGNGTKYLFYESAAVPRYEIITTTGEIFEVRTQGPCRYRKKLRGTNKIFIGIDPKTQETYYRREDGVNCMLWPNGRLVTTFSDGTKITSTPYFDEEVTTEWSEEEKLYFMQIQSKLKLEHDVLEPQSKTILRNSSAAKMTERTSFINEPFICISCSYLMEHPKYTTVFFNLAEPYTTLTMPDEVTMFVYPEGNYKVQKEKSVLMVEGTTVNFSLTCDDCYSKSVATLNFNEDKILCKFVDFFQKVFLVYRNGKTMCCDTAEANDEQEIPINSGNLPPSNTFFDNCLGKHAQDTCKNQRCFVLERDLSGMEFIHTEALALDCYKLPKDTYFDLQSGDKENPIHTFSSPYYKIGYETWVMEYEDKEDSLPTNLKKKDLKELGVKENMKNPFRYPFPKHHNYSEQKMPTNTEKQVQMPKIIVIRVLKCLSSQPNSVIQSIHNYIEIYQRKAQDICREIEPSLTRDQPSSDSTNVQMRLKEIALTLNQTFSMYPHLCTQFPSTEKDIHYSGHFINLMEEFKNHSEDETDMLPDCKQIPKPLPRSRNLQAISEENEL